MKHPSRNWSRQAIQPQGAEYGVGYGGHPSAIGLAVTFLFVAAGAFVAKGLTPVSSCMTATR